MHSLKRIVQVMDYLAVFVPVKRDLAKVVVHSEALKRVTFSEVDNLVCVQPFPSMTVKRCKKSRNLVLESFYCALSKTVCRDMASCLFRFRY